MPSRTARAFVRPAVVMAGAGMLMGIVLPFAAGVAGLMPAAQVLTPAVLFSCLGTGLLVGVVNFAMARYVVGRRASALARSMQTIAAGLCEAAYTGDRTSCDLAGCLLPEAPHDGIGDAAAAFNALLRALERSRETDEQIRSFAAVVGESMGLRRLGADAVEALLPLTGSYGAALTVLTDDGVEVVASAGTGSPPTMAALISRNDLNSMAEPTRVPYGDGIDGMLAPVRVRDEVVGMLLLEGTSYPAGAERHIGLFLPSLGLGVAAALSRERLERAAERDSLTGIRNRRAGFAALGHALDMARSGGTSVGVIICDLDHFKRVNDTHGHPVGDQVLIAAAAAMTSVLRSDDVLARYGGEEFMVVCPGADRTALGAIGERLRMAVAERPYVLDRRTLPMSVSVGGAALGEVIAGSAEILVGAADEALYAAKRGGRNRVVVAPDIATGVAA